MSPRLTTVNWFTPLALLGILTLCALTVLAFLTLAPHIAIIVAALTTTTLTITSAVLSLHFTRNK